MASVVTKNESHGITQIYNKEQGRIAEVHEEFHGCCEVQYFKAENGYQFATAKRSFRTLTGAFKNAHEFAAGEID